MAKRLMLVDAETLTPKQISIAGKIMWNLCQENGTRLQCLYAVKSNKASVGRGTKL